MNIVVTGTRLAFGSVYDPRQVTGTESSGLGDHFLVVAKASTV